MIRSKYFVTLNLGIVLQSSVQFSSVTQSCPALCNPVNLSTPGLPVHHQLPEFTQTHVHWSVMPSNDLILCRPLFLLSSIFPNIRVFSNESALHIRGPKYWSFSFNISPSNGNPRPISRMDWLDLLAVQGTLKSLLTPQFKSINSSALSFLYSPTFTSIHDYWKNNSFNIPWRRERQTTSVFLPGKSQEQGSLAGYNQWGRKESDMTEQLTYTRW